MSNNNPEFWHTFQQKIFFKDNSIIFLIKLQNPSLFSSVNIDFALDTKIFNVFEKSLQLFILKFRQFLSKKTRI